MTTAVELVRTAWSAIEIGDFGTLGGLFADDVQVSTSAGEGTGRDYAVQLFTRHRSGYPDLRHTVDSVIESADGQAAALRITFHATHLGVLGGPFGTVEPTGRELTWRTSDHVAIRGGMITSWHAHFDRLSLLQQLGQLPTTTRPSGRQIVRRILDEAFGQGRLDVLDELMSDDFVNHRVPPGLDPGVGSVKRIIAMERAAFPDLRYEVEQEVEADDVVVALTVARGTHEGAIFGVEPTGRRVEWRQVHIARVRGGRMCEHWGVSDLASLWVQIGRARPIERVG